MIERCRLFVATGGAGALLAIPILADPQPRFVWNASASTPPGLYWVQPGRLPARGDWVVLYTPEGVRALAARRHYLPANVPLVKRVRAVAGDRLCAREGIVSVGGVPVARQRSRDPGGRILPHWQGCRTLRSDEYLVLGDAPDSFDGRYFGPVRAANLLGRAVPLWRR